MVHSIIDIQLYWASRLVVRKFAFVTSYFYQQIDFRWQKKKKNEYFFINKKSDHLDYQSLTQDLELQSEY